MFDRLQKRAWGLCVGVVVAIIFLGKVFGGSLLGLLPLAACIASGVWLWMSEVIRSGREVEWSSEQLRGETVGSLSAAHHWRYTDVLGHCESVTGICRVDEHFFGCDVGTCKPRDAGPGS